MHVQQYQRNENGVGADYDFDIIIYDASNKPIGQVSKQPIDATSKTLGVDSNLPYVLEVTASGGDDAVSFAYAGETWLSTDTTHCQMGGGLMMDINLGSAVGIAGSLAMK